MLTDWAEKVEPEARKRAQADSFSAAEFMRKRYGWEYGHPAYAAASFVAYSRMEDRDHYPQKDVIFGAAIGIASSYLFTKPYKGWHIQAEAGGHDQGVDFLPTAACPLRLAWPVLI